MKRSFKKLFLVVCLFTITSVTYSQGPGPCPGGPPCDPPNPVGVPIDGGLLVLLSSGLVYAVSKLRSKKNQ